MKKLFKPFAALAAFALLAGCAPVVDPLGKNNGNENNASISNTKLAVSSTLAAPTFTGNLKNTAGQHIIATFADVIDQATVTTAATSGITFYTVADATATTLLPLTFKAPTSITFSGYTVDFEFDLSGYTFNTLVYKLNPNLTAKNGYAKLSNDGNSIRGEITDTYISTITVNTNSSVGATAVVTPNGLLETPQATVTFASGFTNGLVDQATYTATPNLGTFTVSSTDGNNNISVTDLAKAFTVFKNVKGSWVSTGITPAVSVSVAAPSYQLTITPAPAVGESYKVVVDKYLLIEQNATLGSIHRNTYTWENPAARYTTLAYKFFVNNGVVATLAPTVETIAYYQGQAYVDFKTANPLDLPTVTNDSLKVYVVGTDVNGASLSGVFNYESLVKQETSPVTPSDVKVTHYRLLLPKSIRTLTTGGFGTQLRFAPTVLTETSTTLSISNVSFGAANAANDGWNSVTF